MKPGPLNTLPAVGSLQLASGSIFCCKPDPECTPTPGCAGAPGGSHTHSSLRFPACEEGTVASSGVQGEGSDLIKRKPFGSSKPQLMKRAS